MAGSGGDPPNTWSPETRLIRLGRSHNRADDPHGALSTPLYQTATFEQSHADGFDRYDYARSQNPTREVLEHLLADLDHAQRAFAYTSGVAALAAVCRLVPAGGNLVTIPDLYAGTLRLLEKVVRPQGVEIRYAPGLSADDIAGTMDDRTAVVLIESPTNPLLRIVDLRAIADRVKPTSAILVVDGTMMTPMLQRPLGLGADLVVHSATKFLGGHSDLTGGSVAGRDHAILDQLARNQNAEGTALPPFDSWLMVRGLKTLAIRMDRQQQNAAKLADWLSTHPAVTRVRYPGGPDAESPDAPRVHHSQASGGGAVLAFQTGSPAFSKAVVEGCELFTIAVSFGSIHSQISMPISMSHSSRPTGLEGAEVPTDLVRVSVGIESADDLIADLDRAFREARAMKDQ